MRASGGGRATGRRVCLVVSRYARALDTHRADTLEQVFDTSGVRTPHSTPAKTRLGIAQILMTDAKRTQEARALLEDARLELRRAGDELGALVAEVGLGEIHLYAHQYDLALAILPGALERSRRIGNIDLEAELLREIGLAFLGCGRRSDARATFAALLVLVEQDAPDAIPELTNALAGIALAAEPVEVHRAARLKGAVDNLRRTNNVTDFPATTALERDFEQHSDRRSRRQRRMGARAGSRRDPHSRRNHLPRPLPRTHGIGDPQPPREVRRAAVGVNR